MRELLDKIAASGLVVAFSGGLDSTVLLHWLSQSRPQGMPLRAIHVDHKLHSDSSRWAGQARHFAESLEVPFDLVELDGKPEPGDSIEDWARRQRYQGLFGRCQPGECILTAHHQDDQLETVWQRIITGAGPRGLGGIPQHRRQHGIDIVRPLLGESRAAIEHYAKTHALSWIQDPANEDLRYLRRRIRLELVDPLEQAFPGTKAGILRLAKMQQQLADTLDIGVAEVLASLQDNYRLPLKVLLDCPQGLRSHVIREAARRAGLAPPDSRQTAQIMRQAVEAGEDRMPIVRWANNELRRYNNTLYFMQTPPSTTIHEVFAAPVQEPLKLPWGVLSPPSVAVRDAAGESPLTPQISVRFRRGGERLRLPGRAHSSALKSLLQQWRVPPWERQRLPLIFVDESLAAVPGFAIDDRFIKHRDALAFAWRWTLYAEASN